MSDVDTTTEGTTPAGGEAAEVDPDAAISRGKGLSLEAVKSGTNEAAKQAVAEAEAFAKEWNDAEAAQAARATQRMQIVRSLKDDHNVGFSAIAEILGNTSSLALYLYERAAGKTAKQIREESAASRLAKEAARVDDPSKPAARKQTPEEREFRKVQREALKAFLAEQRAKAEAEGGDTSEYDAGLADAQAEEDADNE